MEFQTEKKFIWFTKHRRKFEDFLVSHRYFVNQIVNQFGSGFKGYTWVLKLYNEILTKISDNKESDLVELLIKAQTWRLKELTNQKNTAFSGETKNFIVLRDSLSTAVTCHICGARIHRNSFQIDHIIRRQDGGSGNASNGHQAHPFCNTTYKENIVRENRPTHPH
jgi:hypothetical protein